MHNKRGRERERWRIRRVKMKTLARTHARTSVSYILERPFSLFSPLLLLWPPPSCGESILWVSWSLGWSCIRLRRGAGRGKGVRSLDQKGGEGDSLWCNISFPFSADIIGLQMPVVHRLKRNSLSLWFVWGILLMWQTNAARANFRKQGVLNIIFVCALCRFLLVAWWDLWTVKKQNDFFTLYPVYPEGDPGGYNEFTPFFLFRVAFGHSILREGGRAFLGEEQTRIQNSREEGGK